MKSTGDTRLLGGENIYRFSTGKYLLMFGESDEKSETRIHFS